MSQTDEHGYEIVSYRVVWYAEIGYVDQHTGQIVHGDDILWSKPFASMVEATEAVAAHENIVPETRLNFSRPYRTNIYYTDWRIRRAEERLET